MLLICERHLTSPFAHALVIIVDVSDQPALELP